MSISIGYGYGYVSRVETTLNFDLDSAIPAPLNCPYGAPKLDNDTLIAFPLGALADQYGLVDSTAPYTVLGWNLAFQKLNGLTKEINSPFFFTLQLEDTRGDGDLALQKLRKLYEKGIRVFLGPTTSEELKSIKSFVEQTGVVLISPTSTSNEFVGKDSIFRVAVQDSVVASAYASFAEQSEFSTVLLAARNDSYGKSFQSSFTKEFNGSTIPFFYSAEEFNATALASTLNSAATKLGNESFGVLLVSFDEWSSLLSSAYSFPVLRSTTWFGPNTLLSTAYPELFKFANATEVLALLPSVSPHNDVYTSLQATLKTISTTQTPFELFYGYDSALLALYSFFAPQTDKSPYYERSLLETSRRLFLSTGRVALDENGDRIPTTNFDIYKLNVESFTPLQYRWTEVGTLADGVLQSL